MVNKVILMGHAGRDPEVRRMDNNLVVAQFSIATNERWTNKEGNRTDHTEWHNIVMWRGLAEVAEKYVRKGTLVYIEGRLRSRSYDDKEGIKRYVTEILADTMNLVSPKEGGGEYSPKPTAQTASTPPETTEIEPEAGSDLPF